MNSPEPLSGKSIVTSNQSTRLVEASITTAPAVGGIVTDIGVVGATVAGLEVGASSARTRLGALPARNDRHNTLNNGLFIIASSSINSAWPRGRPAGDRRICESARCRWGAIPVLEALTRSDWKDSCLTKLQFGH